MNRDFRGRRRLPARSFEGLRKEEEERDSIERRRSGKLVG